MSQFQTQEDVTLYLNDLSKAEIMAASPGTSWGREDRRNRKHLLETVFSLTHSEQTKFKSKADSKKRKFETGITEENSKKARIQDAGEDEMEEIADSQNAEDCFLKAPPRETIDHCITNFIDRTSNVELAREVCGVCACEVWKSVTKTRRVCDIPNKHLLIPMEPHHAHTLTQGILVERQGISTVGDDEIITLCASCERDLKRSKVPKFALANKMWLGDIPMELATLTLPEKILVAKCFPAAYVVKLFPKHKGAKTWSQSSANTGIKGNVSTYRLNTEDIADLVDPVTMPPEPPLLSAMIGVTIVGPQNLPEKTMPGFLRVKRSRIREGLRWLKKNNPLWGNIVISEERLALYPNEEAVPEEIMIIVKYSNDVEGVDAERAGYVVDDDDDNTGKEANF